MNNTNSLKSDSLVERAVGYPYEITSSSFTFKEGSAQPFDHSLISGRYPIIGYGSNQSPHRLLQKYGISNNPIPVQRGFLDDHDVVYSAHFASYGSLPAALVYVKGATVSISVNWLDESQLQIMHGTEWDHYDYVKLNNISLKLVDGKVLQEAYVYLCTSGCTTTMGAPISLAEVCARGRIYQELKQIDMQVILRDRFQPKMDVSEFIIENVSNEKIRLSRTQHLINSSIKANFSEYTLIGY